MNRARFVGGVAGTTAALAQSARAAFAQSTVQPILPPSPYTPTLRFAVVCPQSGPDTGYGKQLLAGVRGAVEELNRERLLNAPLLLFDSYDDQNTTSNATVQASFATSNPATLAVIGHLSEAATYVAEPAYANAQIALIVPTVTDDRITSRGYRNVFRLPVKDSDEGALLAQYAISTGANAPVVTTQDGDYGPAVAAGFARGAGARHIVAPIETFPLEQPELSGVADRILAHAPDCIVLAGNVLDMGPLIKMLHAKAYTGRLIGSQGFFDAETLKLDPKDIDGLVVSSNMPYYALAPSAQRNVQIYQQQYGGLSPVAAYGYAAVQLINLAVQRTSASDRLCARARDRDRRQLHDDRRIVHVRRNRRCRQPELLLLPHHQREVHVRSPSALQRVHAEVGDTMTALFAGPESLRVRGERASFLFTLATLPISLVVIGWVLQHSITWQELALLVVVAMVYVAFARGRLLGGGLRVHAGQFGHLHAIVDECARMLRMPTPHVFVREDPFVPVVAIGIGDPYAIVISAQYLEHFQEDELRFLIGRELGHIASGHTRYTSLLSSNGRENGVIAIAFGAWLRRIDYTADRAGLLCCGSLDAAMRAIAVSTFQSLGRKIDLGAFAAQLKELHAEPALRMAEWTSSTPYATNRIAALHAFAREPLYERWASRFAKNAASPPLPETAETAYAGFRRRAAAFAIDLVVIQAIVPAAHAVQRTMTSSDAAINAAAADPDVPRWVVTAMKAVSAHGHAGVSVGNDPVLWLASAAYVILLVGLIGQTFGMMIADLRVVGADRTRRVGFRGAFRRYVTLVFSLVAIVGWFSIFRRVQPYETWSRTRLVTGGAPVRS